MRLTGKVAIVTGGSRGIGRRIAGTFGREGARVIVAARSGGEPVADEIRSDGGDALALRCDVSSEHDVRALVATALQRYGRVDLLVNNAALRLATKLLDTPTDDFERIFRVNVLGPFLMWKHVLPAMISGGGGGVINIVSTNAPQQPYFGMAPYRMTKAALTFLSADLAQEVVADHVAVNALDPGSIVSEGTAATRVARERRYSVSIPYHAQDPADVIDAPIVWLACQTAETFTGQLVRRVEYGKTWGPKEGK